MSMSAKLRRAPLRMTTGAFILNSGVSKFHADDDTAKKLYAMAADTLPGIENLDPKVFVKALSVGEIALGSALLVPLVPTVVAGAGLTAFAGALLTMWWRTPGMHEADLPRPTPRGTPIAKDVWMLGAGVSLILDALSAPAHDKKVELTATVHEKAAVRRRQARRTRKAAAAAAASARHDAIAHARDLAAQLSTTASHVGAKASEVGTKVHDAVT